MKVGSYMQRLYIPGFRFHRCSPRTMHYGKLFDRMIEIPFAGRRFRQRMLRVWVPGNFTRDEKIGVIYMVDGQNAVDHNLTAYGEWDMEDHLYNLEKEGYPRFIIVGIDCPHNHIPRAREYTPLDMDKKGWDKTNPCYGEAFGEFIVNEIKPLIDETFNVEHELVGFLGSSMGGLFSFHMGARYPDIFKFVLPLSPCFECYTNATLRQFFDNYHLDGHTENRWAFYMGGADPLERKLTTNCEKILKMMHEVGFTDDNLYYLKDVSKIHHESAWSSVIEELLKWILR